MTPKPEKAVHGGLSKKPSNPTGWPRLLAARFSYAWANRPRTGTNAGDTPKTQFLPIVKQYLNGQTKPTGNRPEKGPVFSLYI